MSFFGFSSINESEDFLTTNLISALLDDSIANLSDEHNKS